MSESTVRVDVAPAANARFAAAAFCAFAAFFAVDWYLFADEGFLRTFGQGTQEGQVLSKVHRAVRAAESADVILFGSSYVRSGVSGEPFLERGLMPFNFAVSGGGPLYDYFALQRIAPILSRRADKPVLVLELKADALLKANNTVWSEYPQYIAIVRSRAEMLERAPLLWRHFRDFNLTSQYLSGLLVPSSIYRSHAVGVLAAGATLDGYFYGVEDFSGFAPLVTIGQASLIPPWDVQPPIPMPKFFPGKVAFLRAFLELARRTGCRVMLYQSPTVLLGRDRAAFDTLIAALQSEFPGVTALRAGAYPMAIEDFDEGGHPNIRGSDIMSRQIIDALDLPGNRGRLDAAIRAIFDVATVPPPAQWTISENRATADGAALVVKPGAGARIAESAPLDVIPDREWVFESAVSDIHGRFSVELSWDDPHTGKERTQGVVTPERASELGSSMRVFLRVRPAAARVRIRVLDYGLTAEGPPSTGRFTPLRLWANR